MKQLVLKPTIHAFDTCKEFAKEFGLGKGDLVLTNEYIYMPLFKDLGNDATIVYQEKFGMGEPTDVMVEAILAESAGSNCKRIIAIGGGTVIDIAKVMAVTDKANVDELYAAVPNLEKKRQLVIIPTTCGTGSEVTNIAILNRTRMGTKMGLVAEAMYADCAVLIPELLQGLPFGVFATSSIDALVHAAESSLSPNATPFTKLFGYKAIEIIIKGYQEIVAKGTAARVLMMMDFLTASCYAGIAFGTAGCAAVHAMSYPLGGKYHVAHGESNYAMFTGVLKKYLEIKNDGEIAVMNKFLAGLLDCKEADVYDALENLLNQILPKKRLREYGATEADMQEFTDSVMTAQGRLMKNNFVTLDAAAVKDIFDKLY